MWPLNLAGCWHRRGGSERKCLSLHQLLVLTYFNIISIFQNPGKTDWKIWYQKYDEIYDSDIKISKFFKSIWIVNSKRKSTVSYCIYEAVSKMRQRRKYIKTLSHYHVQLLTKSKRGMQCCENKLWQANNAGIINVLLFDKRFFNSLALAWYWILFPLLKII